MTFDKQMGMNRTASPHLNSNQIILKIEDNETK